MMDGEATRHGLLVRTYLPLYSTEVPYPSSRVRSSSALLFPLQAGTKANPDGLTRLAPAYTSMGKTDGYMAVQG